MFMKKIGNSGAAPSEGNPSGGAAVELVHVQKTYGDFTAIADLNLQVAEGEFLSIIGPSGCGKSTTLRMIGGFLKPTAGQVFLKGKDVTGLDASCRDTCMVFQDYALFPHMAVLQNVAFGLKMSGVGLAQRNAKAKEALELVGLAGSDGKKPSQLSGGQRQRVALARSIVMHPSVLLLDEPLGALDAQIRRQMQLELKKLQKQLHHTFIYVTHDQEEAMTMSDRILILRDGAVQQLGTPNALYDSPCSLFVAKFLGDCSVLEGQYDGQTVTTECLGAISGRLTAKPFTGHAAVCIRPEKLKLHAPEEPAAADYSCTGQVESVIYKGINTRILVRCGQQGFVCEVAGHTGYREGDAVKVAFDTGDAIVVPFETVDIHALVSQEDSYEKRQ